MAFEGRLRELSDKMDLLDSLINLKHVISTEDHMDIENREASYTEFAKLAATCTGIVKDSKQELHRTQRLSEQINSLAEMLHQLNERMDEADRNLPQYINATQSTVDEESSESASSNARRANKSSDKENRKTSNDIKTSKTRVQKKAPQLPYLTANEFESVPKYMKGRILYSEANKAIDIINQVADAKYKIVYKTKGLTDYERRKKADFAALDGKESEHFCYITEEDIKEFASLKLDKQFLSLLTIIRHCGKVKQVRSGRTTKYLLTV